MNEELGRQVKASFPNSKYSSMSDAMVGELYARKYRKTGAGAGDGTYTPSFSPFGQATGFPDGASILDYNKALGGTVDPSQFRTQVKEPTVVQIQGLSGQGGSNTLLDRPQSPYQAPKPKAWDKKSSFDISNF